MGKRISAFFLLCCLGPILLAVAYAQAPVSSHKPSFTNALGMQFIRLKAGSFMMGSQMPLWKKFKTTAACLASKGGRSHYKDSSCQVDHNEVIEDKETPRHRVTFIKAFDMGVHEVTYGQFKKFIQSAGLEKEFGGHFKTMNQFGDDVPVVSVSWNDAADFVRWLNKVKPAWDGGTYALPTEAQWEYGARAGTSTAYSFGDTPAQIDDYAWFENNAFSDDGYAPQKIGTKKPNAWGLYDMHGNVWEWTADWFNPNYYSISPPVEPTGAPIGFNKVYRGGGWYSAAEDLRSATRSAQPPENHYNYLGFRVVRYTQMLVSQSTPEPVWPSECG